MAKEPSAKQKPKKKAKFKSYRGKNELKKLRSSYKLSQKEASEKYGCSRALWSAWENQERTMSCTQLNQLQKKFELPDERIAEIRQWWGLPARPASVIAK